MQANDISNVRKAIERDGLENLGCDHLIQNNGKLLTLFDELAAAAVLVDKVAADTKRLEFVTANDAFLLRKATDAGGISHQLFIQNEDEELICLHDENQFFPTPRAAIDAALQFPRADT